VIDYLEAVQSRGTTHILLDDGARDGLRELYERARSGGVRPQAPPPDMPDEAAAPVPPARVTLSGASRAEQLESVRLQAENWSPAQRLGTLREKMVFSTGNPEARLMLVGEAPGYEEEKHGEPFVGPAGQKLNDILKAMGIFRQETYLTNMVKFRPAIARQATNNRPPNAVEIAACLPLIRAEIGIVRPECIIALGGTAAEGLLGPGGTVVSMRGSWHEYEGIPVRVTYHPSHLLRNDGNNHAKRELWEDMLAVLEKLGLPVSEKQRGYFLPKA
jgi:uracil-DNA glycosylase